MINKIFKHGTGKAKRAIDYILNNREKITTHYGKPRLVEAIADGLDFKNKYTSGVLSFSKEESKNLTDEQLEEILKSHREQMSAGIGIENLSITYVEHHEGHDHREIHFVAANVDLKTNRFFNPFVSVRGDITRFNYWRDAMVLGFGLVNPNDKKAAFIVNSRTPKLRKDFSISLNEKVEAAIEKGEISSLKNVIEFVNGFGFRVSSTTKERPNSISFEWLDDDGKQVLSTSGKTKGKPIPNMRLSGLNYNKKEWEKGRGKDAKQTKREISKGREKLEGKRVRDLRAAKAGLEKSTRKLIEQYGKRYQSKAERAANRAAKKAAAPSRTIGKTNSRGLEATEKNTAQREISRPFNSLDSRASYGNISSFLYATNKIIGRHYQKLKANFDKLLSRRITKQNFFTARQEAFETRKQNYAKYQIVQLEIEAEKEQARLEKQRIMTAESEAQKAIIRAADEAKAEQAAAEKYQIFVDNFSVIEWFENHQTELETIQEIIKDYDLESSADKQKALDSYVNLLIEKGEKIPRSNEKNYSQVLNMRQKSKTKSKTKNDNNRGITI